jgi:hypothetical protein
MQVEAATAQIFIDKMGKVQYGRQTSIDEDRYSID